MLHKRGSCRRELNYVASYLVYTLVAIAAGDVSATIVPDGRVHLIQLPSRRTHIYDDVRNVLYISTTTGSIERYELTTRSFLQPLSIGGDPGTLELSIDNSFLFVTDWLYDRTRLRLNQVNLHTGEIEVFHTSPVSPIPGLEPLESRFFDIAIGTQGIGLITSDFLGDSAIHTPLRSFDSFTKAFSIRTDLPFYPNLPFAALSDGTQLYRNVERDTFLILETNVSPARARTFDAADNRFIAAQVVSNGSNVAGAVSNDGALVAIQAWREPTISIFTSALEPVVQLSGYDGGFEFDPQKRILYVVDSNADQLAALSTDSWQELYRLNLNEDVSWASPLVPDFVFGRSGDGVMSISRSGRFIFLSTPSGIRVIDLVPEPSNCILVFIALALMDFHRCISWCKV
jgi:hypothetical protein